MNSTSPVDIYVGGTLAAQMAVSHSTPVVDFLGSVCTYLGADKSYSGKFQVYDAEVPDGMVLDNGRYTQRYIRRAAVLPVLLPGDLQQSEVQTLVLRDLRSIIRDRHSLPSGSNVVARTRIVLVLTQLATLADYIQSSSR